VLRKTRSEALCTFQPSLGISGNQIHGFNPRRPPHLTRYKSMTYSKSTLKSSHMTGV